MASVFKRDGDAHWLAKFKNERNKWVTRSCGDADQATAKRWAAAWEADARDVRDGRVDPRAQGYRKSALRPIAEHVEEFRAMLQDKGNTLGHVALVKAHVDRVVALTGAKHLADLSADAVQKAIGTIKGEGLSLRTCNAILRSVKTFGGWLEAGGRIRHNDLRNVKGFNDATDKRRVRRDISDNELGRIIAAAKAGRVSFGLSGEDRAIAYKLAAGTGFRRGELASMTKVSFTLDGDAPTVSVAAAYSKRRRGDTQPIDADLAADLAKWLNGKPAGVPLLPLTRKTAEMMARDMWKAKRAWMREAATVRERWERRKSEFLNPADGEGRVFDFHALRHHYISRVVQSGASVKVCQELARHSTPVLTLGRYAHVRLADLRKALPTVPTGDKPTAEPAKLKATGTDDAAPNQTSTETSAPPAHQAGRETVRSGATNCEATGNLRLVGSERNTLGFAGKSETPRSGAGLCDKRGRRGSNPQPPDRQSGKDLKISRENQTSEAERTTGAPNDPDLAAVLNAWPSLPAALRAGILAMVKAAQEPKTR